MDTLQIVRIMLQDQKARLFNGNTSGIELGAETDRTIPLPLVLDKFKVRTTGLCGELKDR